MAWPKKNTRTVVVNGEAYQWHLDPDECLWRWIVVRKKSTDNQLLFLDPYWLSTTPGQICQAIAYALSAGWEPHRKAKPIRLGSKVLNNSSLWKFYLLPDDAVPGQMPRTLGAGSPPSPATVALANQMSVEYSAEEKRRVP